MRSSCIYAVMLVAAVVVGSVAPIGRADEPAKASSDSEAKLQRANAALAAELAQARDEINRLKEQKQSLEDKLIELQKQLARRPIQDVPAVRVAPRLEQAVPKEWVPRQFNGTTYYLIPLKSSN